MKKTIDIDNIYDMHCHILYGVDDGSKSLEQSLRMVDIAYEEGIRNIILTPHYNPRMWTFDIQVVNEHFLALKDEVAKKYPSMKLWGGCEIFYGSDTPEALKSGQIPGMAGGDYMLIEFMTSASYRTIKNAVIEFQQQGKIPILAHVERYESLFGNVDLVEELQDAGAYIQVNASSVIGDHGKPEQKFVKKLLKLGLVNFIGTDAHRDDKRAPRIAEAAAYIAKKYGEDYARELLVENPQKVVENQYL